MKTADQVKPNYGPVYAAAMYPRLAQIAVNNGYALAVHGSLQRDFDLIAVPWTDQAVSPEELIKAITGVFAVELIGKSENKKHGRVAYTLSCGFGECAIDLSFMPRIPLCSP
jgi:hypothetical protein